jgi:hypothetical protein
MSGALPFAPSAHDMAASSSDAGRLCCIECDSPLSTLKLSSMSWPPWTRGLRSATFGTSGEGVATPPHARSSCPVDA